MSTTIYDKLPRMGWASKIHSKCNGLIVSLYIYRGKKWLKIGEICRLCGKLHIYKKYEKGFKNV